MNTKKYTGIILAAIMVASVFAAGMPAMVSADPVGPTTATFDNQSRYDPSTTAKEHVARGGNITSVTLTSTTLTGKWQGYFGSVTEKITLRDGDGDNTMFNWTATNATGGEVIATTNTSVNWANPLSNVTNATKIDDAWSFGAVADNATKTFTHDKASVKISDDWVNSTKMAYTYNSTGGDTWETVAAKGLGGSGKEDFLFAGIISTGDSYKGTTVDFQMIVPTDADDYETYYFYVEL
jgi:hypothetical protein